MTQPLCAFFKYVAFREVLAELHYMWDRRRIVDTDDQARLFPKNSTNGEGTRGTTGEVHAIRSHNVHTDQYGQGRHVSR